MIRFEGIADQLGVRIEHHDHLPYGHWGQYWHHHRTILLLDRLAPVQQLSTLAHEVGHAVYGHTDTCPRWELEADLWAAQQLIRASEWGRVTAAYDDLPTVAAELQVLPRIATVYAEHLALYPAETPTVSRVDLYA